MAIVAINTKNYNNQGIIYNELIDVVKKHINLNRVSSLSKMSLSATLHQAAEMIQEEFESQRMNDKF